jgi:hypothetical protein
LMFKGQDQKIAACGSSYRDWVKCSICWVNGILVGWAGW